MEALIKTYTIGRTFLGVMEYYNFKTESFNQDYRHQLTDDHRETEAKAREVLKGLFDIEQAKTYGGAKPLYLHKASNLLEVH